MKVAVLGASNKPHRYSNMASRLLRNHGHEVLLVNPAYKEIDGERCFASLDDLPDDVHTLTVYLNSSSTLKMIDQIEALELNRIILNPGTSSPELIKELTNRNISYLEACTLVMLNTDQF